METNDFILFMLLSNNSTNKKGAEKGEKKEKTLEEKIKILNATKARLKTEFYGIDETIDKIIESVKGWYLFPESLTRPTIVNLWGLTGVGKTDFVKKLRRYLQIEKFVNIELDNDGTRADSSLRYGPNGYDNIGRGILSEIVDNDISTNDQFIILLDEVHRAGTIDKKQKDRSSVYKDLWIFLSDGSLFDDSIILKYLRESIDSIERRFENIKINTSMNDNMSFSDKYMAMMGFLPVISEDERKKESEERKSMLKSQGYVPYDIKKMQKSEFTNFFESTTNDACNINLIANLIKFDKEDTQMLKQLKMKYQGYENYILDETFRENSQNIEKYLRRCSNQVLLEFFKYKYKKLLEEQNKLDSIEQRIKNMNYVYSKALVFICGNTDEKMYENDKTPTVEEIKEFLKDKYMPEQISRFGSTYIIYPVIREESYEKLIDNEIKVMKKTICDKLNTNPNEFDDNIIKNRVKSILPKDFVKQGVRPVYSAIQEAVSTIVSDKVMKEKLKSINDEEV